MTAELIANHEERVLLLAPTKRDAAAAQSVFETEGIAVTNCEDMDEVCSQIEQGAAVAILPEEAIRNDAQGHLSGTLKQQPPWSDLPLIVLACPDQTPAAARQLESIGSMTLLPRPVEIRSLVSTVRTALRDRRRQYERRAHFADRERQASALRDNDRRKDEFLAMLAHELRNPLAAIAAATNVARITEADDERRWAVQIIEEQGRNLTRMVDDLLDVSRITTGKIELRKRPVELAHVIRQALDTVHPLVEDRKHRLTVVIAPGLRVDADPTRLAQVFANLLTNAAKYTPAGGRLEVEAHAEAEDVVIVVRDNGLGIPGDRLPEMFELFAQADHSLARSEGGLGIGLTVVKKLVEMHGGILTAASDGAGKGSEFTVRLRAATAPADAAGAGAPSSRPRAARVSRRVLLVDDNAALARAMCRLLRTLGHQVETCHDGPTAIAIATNFRPEVIFLDIGLPGMDGYEVARRLRQEEPCSASLLVAVSGYGAEANRRKSRDAGFDEHLVKPVSFEDLAEVIDTAGQTVEPREGPQYPPRCT
jgi:signal transduction histidine kinase/ActR/RegA family two-component response regulator